MFVAFFKIGVTFALVQSFRSVPFSSEWINMAVMTGANSADNSFKMRLGILSGPLALRMFSCPRSFFTPGSVIFSFELCYLAHIMPAFTLKLIGAQRPQASIATIPYV